MKGRFSSVVPYLVLLLGILAISTASILIRFAQREVPSLVIAAYRLGIATLLLLPVGWRQKEFAPLSARERLWVLASGLFLACHFAAWITSLEYTTVASSVVLVTTTPLWVALFSPLLLREKNRQEVWLGLVLAMIGGIWIGLHQSCRIEGLRLICGWVNPDQKSTIWLGNLLALSGAFFASGYMIAGRRVRPKLSLLPYITVVYGVAAIVLLGFAVITRQSLWPYSPHALMYLMALAVIPQIVGHSAFNWALRFLPASFVTLGLLGEPVGTIILASLFLMEMPTWSEVLGGGVILLGIYLASRANPPS
ncbi:DMT family transporter [uncultured Thermanaerothrix sp.]|uniref:DMT family transporter n=1 Tax=uncultured Thermanaerothrix sp. TaxID=1195149 RepID=UPI0026123CFC|nr:DMT family transporter [uncultured Thermanaerothrix sp.]